MFDSLFIFLFWITRLFSVLCVGESDFAFSVDTALPGNNGFLRWKYDSGDGLHLSNRGKAVFGKLVADTIVRVSK